MINIKKYKHVIWDWNGTLFNDIKLCVNIMNELLEEADLPRISIEKYRNVFTFPVKDYYKKLGHDVGEKNWEKISHQFINEYEKRKYDFTIYSEAKEVLHTIKNYGITQSVLSAYRQETLDELIAFFGLTKYFVRLIGLNNIYAASKLDNGLKWITELNLNPEEVLFVGDTIHDCEVAKAMETDVVLLSCGHQAEEKLKSCNVPLLENLKELIIVNNV